MARLLLAHSGLRCRHPRCPLAGGERTCIGGAAMSANDPKRTARRLLDPERKVALSGWVNDRSITVKAAVGALMKDKWTARIFFARKDLAEGDIVVACCVYRRDPAAQLAGGALQQWKSVRTECDG